LSIEYEQGDIFQVGSDEGYDFMLVFGHIGLGEMAQTWSSFKKRFPNLRDIDDPFRHVDRPISFSSGKWLQFVPEETNNGIGVENLRQIIDTYFGWAAKTGLRSVITNGVKDTDHGRTTALNRASDDRRVKYIDELVRRHLPNFESIKLISLNDAYTRNFRR